MEQIHATCVEIDGAAVLIRGDSGAGKSDLALRLVDQGGTLVADDRVNLAARDGALIASVPAEIEGKLEVRGLGIVEVDWISETRVCLVVDLAPPERIERHPEPERVELCGIALRRLALSPFDASVTAKVRLAVRRAQNGL